MTFDAATSILVLILGIIVGYILANKFKVKKNPNPIFIKKDVEVKA